MSCTLEGIWTFALRSEMHLICCSYLVLAASHVNRYAHFYEGVMALAKNCHNQFYRNQILMQPIKMTTQHAPRRAYLFSFGGQKLVAQGKF
jgi:hypothetical protein